MENRQYKSWMEEYAKTSGQDMPEDGIRLLDDMIRDGLDYEKYDLNPQQVLFCIYYVFHTGNNAKKAALKAGYTPSYSTLASSWIRGKTKNPSLTDFISELVSSFGASPTQVVGFLTFIMQNDFWGAALTALPDGDIVPEDILKQVKKLGLTALIKDIKWHHNGKIQSIILHDAMKAAELLGQTHGMYKKHVEINNLSQAAKDAGLSDDAVEKMKQAIAERTLEEKRTQAESRLSQNGASA